LIPGYYFFRGRYALGHFLKSLNLPKDSQIAIQAFTCVAVVEGIALSGSKPIYIDILEKDVVMDPADLLKKLTARTKVVVVQHTFGRVADMNQISALCRERGLILIEDCCHTWSSKSGSKEVGSFGVASFYSFEWGKPVIAGIGGFLRLNDQSLGPALVKHLHAEVIEPPLFRRVQLELQYIAFRLFFRPKFYWKLRKLYHFLSKGRLITASYNPSGEESPESKWSMSKWARLRLKTFDKKLARLKTHSSALSQVYDHILGAFDLPRKADGVFAHRFPLFVKNKEELLKLASKKEIEIAGWYDSPIHPLKGSELNKVGYLEGSCPNAERASSTLISLPTHLTISKCEAEKIANFVKNYGN